MGIQGTKREKFALIGFCCGLSQVTLQYRVLTETWSPKWDQGTLLWTVLLVNTIFCVTSGFIIPKVVAKALGRCLKDKDLVDTSNKQHILENCFFLGVASNFQALVIYLMGFPFGMGFLAVGLNFVALFIGIGITPASENPASKRPLPESQVPLLAVVV